MIRHGHFKGCPAMAERATPPDHHDDPSLSAAHGDPAPEVAPIPVAPDEAIDAVARAAEDLEDAAETVGLELPELEGAPIGADHGGVTMDLLHDVELDVKLELGRTQMYVEDVLCLNPGSIVELDKAAGDPVDIYVNDRRVARGEVLVLNDSFCVRVSEILDPDDHV